MLRQLDADPADGDGNSLISVCDDAAEVAEDEHVCSC